MDNFTAQLTVNSVIITINANTLSELTEFVERITAGPKQVELSFEDRPDVGAPEAPPLPPAVMIEQATAALAFGGALTPEQMVAARPAAPELPGLPADLLTQPAVSAEVDSAGVRWDARIHSSTKTKVANGEWRARKGADPVLVEQVLAEQKQLAALPAAPAAAVTVSTLTSTSTGPGTVAVGSLQPTVQVPVMPAVATVPAVPVMPPPPAVPTVTKFSELCDWLNGPMLAVPPKLSMDDVVAELSKHGMKQLQDLMMRQDYVPVVHQGLSALVAGR